MATTNHHQPSSRYMEELKRSLLSLEYSGVGLVKGLVEKPGPGIHASRTEVTVLKDVGCSGDHKLKDHWKGARVPGREVTMFSAEVAACLRIDPVVVGDNIVTQGLNLAHLNAGERLRVGEVVLKRSEKPHRPCDLFASRISEDARKAVQELGLRGALFYVEQGGSIKLGDSIVLEQSLDQS